MSAPWFLSTDSIRIRLAQELSSWTGYSVQLKAPPQVTIFPQFKARVEGVVLSSPEDISTPLMEADNIEFNLSLFAALQGQVAITESRVFSPVFTLDEPVKNFNDALQKISESEGAFGEAIREARQVVEKNPNEANLNYLLKHPFGNLIIKDGTIKYRKAEKDELETISHVDATLDLPVKNGQASFVIQGQWHSEMTELRFEADQILLLFAHVASPARISINSRRGGITYSGLAKYDGTFFLDGHLSARSPGLDQTLTWLELEHTMGINVKEPVIWESSFSKTPERIELNNVRFTLNDDNARGALEITNLHQTPLVTGSLAFQSLNLDTLLKVYFPDKENKQQYDLNFLKEVDFDVRFSSPNAKFSSVNVTNLAASLQLRNGRGIFDVGNANIFDGLLQSNIQVFMQDDKPIIEASLSGSNIETKSILSAIQFPPIVEGKSEISLKFKAPFVHWSQLSSAMNGTFSISMEKGQVLGYDFSDFENRLMNEHIVVFSELEKGVFPFKWLAAIGKISHGRINVENGVLVNGDKKYTFKGLIPYGIARHPYHLISPIPKQLDFSFNIVQSAANSSTTVCSDVECLQNSLIAPIDLFLLGNQERLSITTPVVHH